MKILLNRIFFEKKNNFFLLDFFFVSFLFSFNRNVFILKKPIFVSNFIVDFYEDIFLEMSKHGKVLDQVVCENAGQHLCGEYFSNFHSNHCFHDLILFSNVITHTSLDSKAILTSSLKTKNKRRKRCKRWPVASTQVSSRSVS